MASSAPHIVLISVNDGERTVWNDRVVAASTVPGSLVEVASTGKLAKAVKSLQLLFLSLFILVMPSSVGLLLIILVLLKCLTSKSEIG